MEFTFHLLLPQPLLCIEDEPDPVQREIQGGRCGVAGAVDGLRVLVTAEHLDGLILDAFAVDLDDRVGAMHVDPVPTTRGLRTGRGEVAIGATGPCSRNSSAFPASPCAIQQPPARAGTDQYV